MPTPSIIDTRRDGMFPTLQPFEIERVWRFGEVRSYKVGKPLAKVGEVARGCSIILPAGSKSLGTINRATAHTL